MTDVQRDPGLATGVKEDPARPVRVAVVGLGYWGPGVVRNLLSIEGCEVAALVDDDVRRLEAVRALCPGVAAGSWASVIDDSTVDAVVLATPAATHYDLAAQALLRGKDVLVEKPLALEKAQAVTLVELAERGSNVLMVGHTSAHQPA